MSKVLSWLLVFTSVGQALLLPVLLPASVWGQTQNPLGGGRLTPSEGGSQDSPEVKGASQATYSYDASGNLVDDGERTIIWDVEGKPVKIVVSGQKSVVSFVYDSSGSRIAKIVKDQAGNTLFATLYVGGSLEKETSYNSDGSIASQTETKYYPAGSSLAQRKVNLQTGEDELIFIHKDHLSSSTFFTDKQGNKADSLLTYYPYGEERQGWDSQQITNNKQQTTNRLYTGQIKDQETGLYYYNARYYNPKTGLFISADTVSGGNSYAYGANNPIRFSDPTGNYEEEGAGYVAPASQPNPEDERRYVRQYVSPPHTANEELEVLWEEPPAGPWWSKEYNWDYMLWIEAKYQDPNYNPYLDPQVLQDSLASDVLFHWDLVRFEHHLGCGPGNISPCNPFGAGGVGGGMATAAKIEAGGSVLMALGMAAGRISASNLIIPNPIERIKNAIRSGDKTALKASLTEANDALTGQKQGHFLPNDPDLDRIAERVLAGVKEGHASEVVYLGDGGLSRIVLSVRKERISAGLTSNSTPKVQEMWKGWGGVVY